ncbi:unnamed protein product [Hymenolepis diminuta]|uniref:Galactose oxidase n=1 Tax=Hymenolepis diminuta TaxID=6216 RepID=A0A0R3SXB8_HYMDI|nr:unnamed protein product [Hymenolepis diminuta]
MQNAFSSRWSPPPPMIEERTLCAAVSIANTSVLVIGGIGRNQVGHRSTELLTQLAGEEGGGGGEKWQWRPFSPINEEQGGAILAAYLQGRIYVIDCEEYVDAMEMLDVTADGQWTSLTSNGWSLCQPLRVLPIATSIEATYDDKRLHQKRLFSCNNLTPHPVKSEAHTNTPSVLQEVEVRNLPVSYKAFQYSCLSPKQTHTPSRPFDLTAANYANHCSNDVITEGRWLAEAWKTAKKQTIASSSMPSSSTEAKGQSTKYGDFRFSLFESQERLATLGPKRVCILNPECTEVEIEHQLPVRGYRNVVAFQNKLVFIGGRRSENNPDSKGVDVMDISTGQVSSLPDMIKARYFSDAVATENQIFVFGTGRWSLLPPMIDERFRCAAVNIPDSGILVIGGIGRNQLPLRSTELLTRRSGEGGGGGGDKWQWLPYPPMNKEHSGHPLAVYFQGRVYVVGYMEVVNEMEMLDVAAGSQWTSLTTFSQRPRLIIYSMTKVGNELLIKTTACQMEKKGICSCREVDHGSFKMMESPIWTQSSLLREQRHFLECCIPANIFNEYEDFMK